MKNIEKMNAQMVNSPEDAIGDAHIEWFRLTMSKIKHFPDHLTVPIVKRMLSTITEMVAEAEAARNWESRE